MSVPLTLEHGDSPHGRWLRRHRLQVALGVAILEGLLVVVGPVPWWVVVLLAVTAFAVYRQWGRRSSRPLVRTASWIAAVSQLVVVLVPIGAAAALVVALVLVVLFAIVALATLLVDRR